MPSFNAYPAFSIKQPDFGRILATAALIKSSRMKNRLAQTKIDRMNAITALRSAAIGSLSDGGQVIANGGADTTALNQSPASNAASGVPVPGAGVGDLSQYAGPPSGPAAAPAQSGERPSTSPANILAQYAGPTVEAGAAHDKVRQLPDLSDEAKDALGKFAMWNPPGASQLIDSMDKMDPQSLKQARESALPHRPAYWCGGPWFRASSATQ